MVARSRGRGAERAGHPHACAADRAHSAPAAVVGGDSRAGQASAREIEAFFAAHPQLTERARALITQDAPGDIVPLERMTSPRAELDGSRGRFRAPAHTCLIDASHDGEAVLSWLQLHESLATRRAYRKEAERLLLWAVIQLGKTISSLTTDDAIAYRAFLRNPMPQRRWVGSPRPRESAEGRLFAGGLAPKSIAYSLSVLGAMFRWLMAQHYVLANPFAGIKVRGVGDRQPLDSQGCGMAMGEEMTANLVVSALNMAFHTRRPESVIHHSDRAANTPVWRSGMGAEKWACGPQRALSGMPTTTRWRRAFSPRWNASCSIDAAGGVKPRRGQPCLRGLRAGTTRAGCTPRWGTCRP